MDYLVIITTAFMLGLAGNVHCLAMCGGIAATCGFSQQKNFINYANKIISTNLARIITYALLGAIVGGLGQLVSVQFGTTFAFVLRTLSAIFMLILGLYLMRVVNVLVYIEKFGLKLWQEVSTKLIRAKQKNTGVLLMGVIWGLLPCGLIYTMLIWVLSMQSATAGFIAMLAFGVGTLPLMLLTGLVGSSVVQTLKKPIISSIVGGLVCCFAVYLLVSGFMHFNQHCVDYVCHI